MRPIPAPRIGESHGLLRAINQRERMRLDEFVTEFSIEDLFPLGLENALGRTRQFVSYARSAGLVKEDRGVVELTEIGKRYVRAGDEAAPFSVSPSQADWLRRQLLEKHMTDRIYHGLAIGLSLLSSVPPGTRISTLDFGRALGYLGRAGWDNDNTLQIQGERYVELLRDLELIDDDRALTRTGHETKSELTLPIHMSLSDLAAQLNPGGAGAVREQGEAEWARAEPEPEAPPAPEGAEPAPAAVEETGEWQDVVPGARTPVAGEPDEPPPPPLAATAPPVPAPVPEGPPVPPAGVYANVAAALAAGKHVVITGAAGSGKTSLALAVAQAAAAPGRSSGAVLVTASDQWSGDDAPGQVIGAAARGKWLVIDELDRAPLDRALGALSSFLSGLPTTLASGEEAKPPEDWRIVATSAKALEASPALWRRFAHVDLPASADGDLGAAIDAAPGGDPAP